MERQQAANIVRSIMRNVEMDGARAQVLRGGVPAPLAEVGEALRMAYNALRGDSDGEIGYGASEGRQGTSAGTERP